MFEPENYNEPAPFQMLIEEEKVFKCAWLPDCHFSVVEMDIQQSLSECAIFSLDLAKKLRFENNNLLRMHQDNIAGLLYKDPEPFLTSDRLNTYFLVSFYKHTQSSKRINKYLEANPHAVDIIVNKKNNTILDRFKSNCVMTALRKISASVHRKRVSEYKTLSELHLLCSARCQYLTFIIPGACAARPDSGATVVPEQVEFCPVHLVQTRMPAANDHAAAHRLLNDMKRLSLLALKSTYSVNRAHHHAVVLTTSCN